MPVKLESNTLYKLNLGTVSRDASQEREEALARLNREFLILSDDYFDARADAYHPDGPEERELVPPSRSTQRLMERIRFMTVSKELFPL